MTKKAFDKIAEGLKEALSVAKGEMAPNRVTVLAINELEAGGGTVHVGPTAKIFESIISTPVAPAEMEMIDEKSIAETSPRKVEEGAQELSWFR